MAQNRKVRKRPAALRTYRRKRDFKRTPEPGPEVASSPGGDNFVVQKHAARRLHYDFRLELDGVLLSWAVPNGPSLDPKDRRLAVRTEDHPLAYGGFEGIIPAGAYGGGTVMLWDRGRWQPEGDPRKGLKKGHLKFELFGERMRGRWNLARMGRREDEPGKENWLLIKGHDDQADPARPRALLEEGMTSVATGRSMAEIAAEQDRVWSSTVGELPGKAKTAPKPKKQALPYPPAIARAPKAVLPAFVPPQLATLSDQPPGGAQWLHEIKLDGYRTQLRLLKGKPRLLTRKGLDWTKKFGPIAKAAAALPEDAILDGEIVALDAAGVSSFAALQDALSTGKTGGLVYFVFDLLYVRGRSLAGLPLEERKAALKIYLEGLPAGSPIRYSDHHVDDGPAFFQHACRLALEGMVSKRRDAPYRSGRGGDWIKVKCTKRQEFVVGGWQPSAAKGHELRAILVGYFQDGKLLYAGKVGTGWGQGSSADLVKRLKAVERKAAPFASVPADVVRTTRWVEPAVVVEVDFATWTSDGILRHASFKGVRDDREPGDVVLEVSREDAGKKAPVPGRAAKSRPQGDYAGVVLTHPDRLLWPKDGITKEALADYYAEVAPRMMPHIVNRPLSLVRCPDGAEGACFFQRHMGQGLPASVKPVKVRTEKEPYLAIGDTEGLFALVQFSTLEIHPWGARADDPERPDRVIMDFDPGEAVPWERVVGAALECRDRLHKLGLVGFVKTTGGKGLHVVFPLARRHSWAEIKAFARGLATAMAADSRLYTTSLAKKDRKGRIFVDYLRNDRTSTAVAPYSTRARTGVPVATPLDWSELKALPSGSYYTLKNIQNRLQGLGDDPWAGIGKVSQRLTAKALRSLGIKV